MEDCKASVAPGSAGRMGAHGVRLRYELLGWMCEEMPLFAKNLQIFAVQICHELAHIANFFKASQGLEDSFIYFLLIVLLLC